MTHLTSVGKEWVPTYLDRVPYQNPEMKKNSIFHLLLDEGRGLINLQLEPLAESW